MLKRIAVSLFAFLPALAAGQVEDELESLLDDLRDAQDVPGVSAVVVRDGAFVFSGASGVADIESNRAMTADTLLYIGSVSKVLTAVLTLQLVEEGEIALNDPVDFVAGADAGTPVLISHLLTHTSGLEREGDFGYWFSGEFPNDTALADWLAIANLRSTPGSTLHYSNTGYAALGRVIEQALGMSYAEALNTRVFDPLGMTNSGARGPAPDVANGYTPRGRLLPSAERPFGGVGDSIDGRHVRLYHNARAMSPAFGAYSSANELGLLALFLLGRGQEEILSTNMRERMRERQPTGRGMGFRLGRVDGRAVARHDGWFAAHRAHLLLDAEADLAVVVLANSDSASARDIANGLYKKAIALTSAPN